MRQKGGNSFYFEAHSFGTENFDLFFFLKLASIDKKTFSFQYFSG